MTGGMRLTFVFLGIAAVLATARPCTAAEFPSPPQRTVLARDGNDVPHVWREGMPLVTLREFLEEYGLTLPDEYAARVWGLEMSPDGRCFSGSRVSSGPRSRSFLACVRENGEDPVSPPSWETPE